MEATKVKVRESSSWEFEVELLGPRLARVLEDVFLTNFRPGTVPCPIRTDDVVRLSHDPGETDAMPTVTEIVYKPRPRFLSTVVCHSDDQRHRLIAVAEVLRAEIQYESVEDGPYPIKIWVMHAEDIDFPAIAKAAGLTRPAGGSKSSTCHLSKIPFFDDWQEYRMIALGVVLGAEVVSVTDPADDGDQGEDSAGDHGPHQMVLFHGDDIDIRAIADAAGVTRNPADAEIGLVFHGPRPGAVPGPEWASGSWGQTNETRPEETSGAAASSGPTVADHDPDP